MSTAGWSARSFALRARHGASFVIAVDISNRPQAGKTRKQPRRAAANLRHHGAEPEPQRAAAGDVVIRPDISQLGSVDFKTRHLAVLEGEKAAALALPALKAKLENWRPAAAAP